MQYFAVFGNPIVQSKSPVIHQMFAKQVKVNIEYTAILAPLDGFETSVTDFLAQPHHIGANVTMPFKHEAFAMCDVLTEEAKSAQAVNTLYKTSEGLLGHNTDGLGLVQDLIRQQVMLKGKRILIIGAGGAAKGIVAPLFAQGIDSMHIINRNVKRAKELTDQYLILHPQCKLTAGSFESVKHDHYDVIINATSLSMSGQIPSLSNHIYKEASCIYDMVYLKDPTAFLTHAYKQGNRHLSDGLGMLVGQAAKSFELWTGQVVDTTPVLDVLRGQL